MAKEQLDAIDFSKKTIDKNVRQTALNHWTTVASSVITIGGFGAAALLGVGVIGFAVAGCGLVLGAGSLFHNLVVRKPVLELEYIRGQRELMKRIRQDMLRDLEGDLKEFGVAKGLKQIQGFHDRFTTLTEMLDDKFKQDDLAYQRFLAYAEEIYNGGVDKLRRIISIHRVIRDIDIKDITKRMQTAEKSSQTDTREYSSLKIQQQIYTTKQTEVDDLLDSNEEALALLTQTSTKIADIQSSTSFGKGEQEMELAMDALRDLANRFKKPESFIN